jgi:glycosyltransferase involved in cell wall biosynthesis
MTPPLRNVPIAMDRRMLGPGGTGVSTYAQALRHAHEQISPASLLVSDRPREGRSLRPWLPRAARALLVGARIAYRQDDSFVWRDLFRVAQVHFNIYGQLLRLRVPERAGIMHWTYPVPIWLEGWKNIYTVHDAIPLTSPQLSPIDPARHRRLLTAIWDRGASVVTVSEAARKEIAGSMDWDRSKIVSCSQPVDLTDVQDVDRLWPSDDLSPGQYLLVCGSVEPRKNIERLLSAYRASRVSLPLVIAGPDGWQSTDLKSLIASTPGVRRLPYQTRGGMIALIRHARAVVMPSLAEGFGLPVAEAMMLGTPVLTSSGGALAETAGNAALLADPTSEQAIAEAVKRLCSDDALCRELSRAGLVRATKHFSPQVFAERLAAVYARLSPDEMAAETTTSVALDTA